MKNWLILGGILLALFFFFSNDFKSFPSTQDSQHKNTTQSQSYKRYECTGDCSGHKAGYEWARKKGINDPDDCGGNSNSFIEGCKSYVNE
jgi:hypothetical protein